MRRALAPGAVARLVPTIDPGWPLHGAVKDRAGRPVEGAGVAHAQRAALPIEPRAPGPEGRVTFDSVAERAGWVDRSGRTAHPRVGAGQDLVIGGRPP